jgi:hypothetical protein
LEKEINFNSPCQEPLTARVPEVNNLEATDIETILNLI